LSNPFVFLATRGCAEEAVDGASISHPVSGEHSDEIEKVLCGMAHLCVFALLFPATFLFPIFSPRKARLIASIEYQSRVE
jgi:hypothetical protein